MKIDESSLAIAAAPIRRLRRVAGRSPLASNASGWIERVLPGAGRLVFAWLPVYAFVVTADRPSADALGRAGCLGLVWFVAFNLARGASEKTANALGPLPATALGTLGGLIAVSSLDSWLRWLDPSLLRTLAMTGSVFVLVLAWETFVAHVIPKRRTVLVVGRTESARELIFELALRERRRFAVIGAIDDGTGDERPLGVPICGEVGDLPAVVREARPDLVVVCSERNRPEIFRRLLEVAESGFRLIGLPEFYEYAFGRVPVRNLSAAWFMSVLHLYQRPYTRFTKRSFDIVAASIGLVLSLPLMAVVAALVSRTPGPVIFRQTRLGENGRHFTILKFRTMRENAEEPGHPVWASKDDPRVTALGRLLRASRLDELPQLWNVLRGDMSIVGPRPERPEFVRLIESSVPFWSRRHLLKPGITGWAQVCRGYAADTESTEEKLSYDLWYLRHRSLLVDLLICTRTLARLLPATSGAH